VNPVEIDVKRQPASRSIAFALVGGTLFLAVGVLFVQFGIRARTSAIAGSEQCSAPLPEREAAVIRAALAQLSSAQTFVVKEQTGNGPSGGLPAVKGSLSTKLSYLYNNNEPRCVTPWNGAPRIRVLRDADIESRPTDVPFSGWFIATFGGGAVRQVSRVGFSLDGKEAIVSIGMYCGGLCGSGRDVRLVWTGGRWQIVEHVMRWIA